MLIVTWHPTYAFFRAPHEHAAFDIDLDRFARLVKGTLKPEVLNIRTVTAPTVKDVKAVLRDGWVAVDVETKPMKKDETETIVTKKGKVKVKVTRAWGFTGKQALRARLKTVGLGNVEWGLSTMWGKRPDVDAAIIKVLNDPKIMKVVHNGIWFDKPVMKRYGIDLKNYVDTRDMRRALSATSRVALGYCAATYLDFPDWKNAEDDK